MLKLLAKILQFIGVDKPLRTYGWHYSFWEYNVRRYDNSKLDGESEILG